MSEYQKRKREKKDSTTGDMKQIKNIKQKPSSKLDKDSILKKIEQRTQMKQQRKAVAKFWEDNYKQNKQSAELIPLEEAYEVFSKAEANNAKTNLETFNRLSRESGISARGSGIRTQYHAISI